MRWRRRPDQKPGPPASVFQIRITLTYPRKCAVSRCRRRGPILLCIVWRLW
jgi:hypothetical protein